MINKDYDDHDHDHDDQDATRIKMQRGQRCNADKDAMRIKLQRGNSVHPSPPSVLNFDIADLILALAF